MLWARVDTAGSNRSTSARERRCEAAASHTPPLGMDIFAGDLCDTLFSAILIDDRIDSIIKLPVSVQLDYSVEELTACFTLAHRLWLTGFDRRKLIYLTDLIRRDGDLVESDRVRFKHMRAKFKHLRYAHALYGVEHCYPRLLNQMTIIMGQIQDACRNQRFEAAVRKSVLLRLLLTKLPSHWLRIEAERLIPTTSNAFRLLIESDAEAMRAAVARSSISGEVLHEVRKRIGRQVSFWDTLRTLEPTTDRFRMSRALSAINGLMGDLHDNLVRRRAADPASYHRPFVLPEMIRGRITSLLPCFGAASHCVEAAAG